MFVHHLRRTGFRPFFMLVPAIITLFLLPGCAPFSGPGYTTNGIGTRLYTRGMAEATHLQELYAGYICKQADIPHRVTADGDYRCNYRRMSARHWNDFVLTGMNDIDRRCDAYLAWYDNKKRSASPLLKQLTATQNATQAIMKFSGFGATPILIAGSAFGIAEEAFTNYNSRLMFAMESSTIQTVVLGRQNDFRKQIARLNVSGKPQAYQTLRSYLRLCMPFTIETEINNVLVLRERASSRPRALVDPTVTRLATTRRAVRTSRAANNARAFRANDRPRYVNRGDDRSTQAKQRRLLDNMELQTRLCVRENEADGIFGPETKALIEVFRDTYYNNRQNLRPVRGAALTSRERSFLRSLAPCVEPYLNLFETNYFSGAINFRPLDQNSKQYKAALEALRTALNTKGQQVISGWVDIAKGSTLDDMRPGIRLLRRRFADKLNGEQSLTSHLTQSFVDNVIDLFPAPQNPF